MVPEGGGAPFPTETGMKSSLLEVIDAVLQRLEDPAQTAENESSIRVWLAGQGYSRRDIDAAMRRGVVRRFRGGASPSLEAATISRSPTAAAGSGWPT